MNKPENFIEFERINSINPYVMKINGFIKVESCEYYWKDFIDNNMHTISAYVIETLIDGSNIGYKLSLHTVANIEVKPFYEKEVKTFTDIEECLKENNIDFTFNYFEDFEDDISLEGIPEMPTISIFKPNGELLLETNNESELEYIKLQIARKFLNGTDTKDKIIWQMDPSGYFIMYNGLRYDITKFAYIVGKNGSLDEYVNANVSVLREILVLRMKK